MSSRLSSSADIRAVFATRRAVSASAVTLHVRARGDDAPARIAVVAGRKVGNAVVRNRAKRRLRAGLRVVALPSGLDVVAVARTPATTVGFQRLLAELRSLAARLTTLLPAVA